MLQFPTIETASGPMFVEYASASETSTEAPIDMHTVIKTGNMPTTTTDRKAVAKSLLEIDGWLPFAAEAYNISANIKDFLVVPTTIFLTDLPNANLAAFPFEEMSRWNTQAGMLSYQTWKGKPTHIEHKNANPAIAAGVIFDSSLRSVPNYVGGLHRVVLLAGWDRNRYPEVAGKIIQGRTGFSMGAMVSKYSCSVSGVDIRQSPHFQSNGMPNKMEVGGKLVYRIAHGVHGFELSQVGTPAWRGAWGTRIDKD